jgi:hypothetical protein
MPVAIAGVNAQGLMNPAEVAMHVMNSNCRNMVLNLFRERICKPRESPHLHSHGQILALDMARTDVLGIGGTADQFLLTANALRWAVAHFKNSGTAFGAYAR